MKLKQLMVITAAVSMAASITACGSGNNNNGEMQQRRMRLQILQPLTHLLQTAVKL